jgi:hypothetical protein
VRWSSLEQSCGSMLSSRGRTCLPAPPGLDFPVDFIGANSLGSYLLVKP